MKVFQVVRSHCGSLVDVRNRQNVSVTTNRNFSSTVTKMGIINTLQMITSIEILGRQNYVGWKMEFEDVRGIGLGLLPFSKNNTSA